MIAFHGADMHTASMPTKGPKQVTDAHKAAMAAGRNDARAVKSYLEGLRANKPKRGRKRTPDSISKRLAAIDAELIDAGPLDELKLVQERRDLTAELAAMGSTVDLTELEDAFVKVAKQYSTNKGIDYATWRDVGVSAAVLKRAGISRSA
jgi:hypothetical protein